MHFIQGPLIAILLSIIRVIDSANYPFTILIYAIPIGLATSFMPVLPYCLTFQVIK